MLSRRTVSSILSQSLSFTRRYASSAAAVGTMGVIGSGQMGLGIGHVASQVAGKNVVMVDVSEARNDAAKTFLDKLLKKNVEKGKMSSEDAAAVMSRISFTTDLNVLEKTDFVVEAASENVDLKLDLFSKISQITPSQVILASNTSSISITKIAAATNRPDKVIGMHFMNPVPVMKLVEVISGAASSEETLKITLDLAGDMGKITTSSADYPGFIANRLLMPYINESVYTLMEGVASKEDIDTTMKLGTNVPMGPLTLADFIGLDTCLAIMKVLHEGLGDSKYRPCPLLVQYVNAGFLGKKSGRGFYSYGK